VTRFGFAVVALSLAALGFAQQGGPYCILRNQDLYGPPTCFQFYLADTSRTSGQMAALDAGGGCVATDLARRQGWEVDPTLGGPYWNWEAGTYQMSVLSRYGGDAYGCLAGGGGTGTPPPPPRATPPTPGPTPNPFGRYCVLRDPDLYGPPNCFQFYLADTTRTSGQMAFIDAQGFCRATPLAQRQDYEVDPNLGGPYRNWEAADFAMTQLSRYGDDFYGCLAAQWGQDPDDPDPNGGARGPNSCPWAYDGECDEPGIGTGLCAAGTDQADCAGAGGPNSCRWAFDGECDEPGIGTGYCDAGTDQADCANVGGPDSCRWAFDGECDEPGIGTGVCAPGTDTTDCQAAAPPVPGPIDMPEEVEERDQELDVCADWVAADSGGVEGTVDTWDISAIPHGATFDIAFDAHDVPDSFRVSYQGATVLDTGWRGGASYADKPRYAAGIAGPGEGQQDGLFVKRGTTSFTVTVIGGEDGTVWDYRVRCRTQ
jgi:hypothetical protein